MNMNPMQGGIMQALQAQPGAKVAPGQENWEKMDPAQLAQFANNPRDAGTQLLALAEVERRNRIEKQQRAEQAKQMLARNPGTVADRVKREAGIAGLTPAQPNPMQMPQQPMPMQQPMQPQPMQMAQAPQAPQAPQQFAGGGIVAFQSGGSGAKGITDTPGVIDNPRRIRYDTGTLLPPVYTTDGSNEWLGDIAHGAKNWLQRTLVDYSPVYQANYSNEGIGRTLPAMDAERIASGVDGASPNTPPPWAAVSRPQTPPWFSGEGSGIARVAVQGGAGRGSPFVAPEWVDPTAGAPSARMTPEQRDAQITVEYERLKKLYGEDVAEKYLKQIQGEREGMTKKYADNKNEALLRAGLAMMGGKSKHAAVNIGEGGIAGLNAFQAGNKDLDAQSAALRREEMAAALGSQARQDQMRAGALGQVDKRDAEMRQDRTEYMENMRNWNTFRQEGAKLGIEDRKVSAMFANVDAEMAKVKALYGAQRDDRLMKLITDTQNKEVANVLKEAETNPTLRQRLMASDRALMDIVLPRVTAQVEQAKAHMLDLRGSGINSGGGGGITRFDASQYFSRAPTR